MLNGTNVSIVPSLPSVPNILSGGFYGLYDNLMAVMLGADLSGFGLGSAEENKGKRRYVLKCR
jgi:hypothetical protein